MSNVYFIVQDKDPNSNKKIFKFSARKMKFMYFQLHAQFLSTIQDSQISKNLKCKKFCNFLVSSPIHDLFVALFKRQHKPSLERFF